MYPMIMWFGPEGMIGSSTDALELGDIVHMGETFSRTLTFNSLSPRQTGNYVCSNTVTDPFAIEHFVFIASKSLQHKKSSIYTHTCICTCRIIFSLNFVVCVFLTDRSISITDPPTVGQPFTASCEVVVPDSLAAAVEVVLFDPAGQEVASVTGLNSAEAVFLLPSLQESDQGEYRCTSAVFSPLLNSPVVAEQTFIVDSKHVDCNFPYLV